MNVPATTYFVLSKSAIETITARLLLSAVDDGQTTLHTFVTRPTFVLGATTGEFNYNLWHDIGCTPAFVGFVRDGALAWMEAHS